MFLFYSNIIFFEIDGKGADIRRNIFFQFLEIARKKILEKLKETFTIPSLNEANNKVPFIILIIINYQRLY